MTVEMETNTEITKSLEDLYLNEDLRGLSDILGRSIVSAGYVCDLDHDGIATKSEGGAYKGLKNKLDWGIFQRLIAHADAIVTGADYLERVKSMGLENAQNVLNQFSEGPFKFLGDWRESKGIKRNPDIIVISRSLDVYVPPGLLEGGRKLTVFTTHSSSVSPKATDLRKLGVNVVDAGTADDAGVDGNKLYDYLNREMKYKVVEITTGPRVLEIFKGTGHLDVLYVDRVHKNIEAQPDNIVTIETSGKKLSEDEGLKKVRSINITGVELTDGSRENIDFETYVNAGLPESEKQEFLKRIKSI